MLRSCVTVDGFELEGGHLVAAYERKKCSLNFVMSPEPEVLTRRESVGGEVSYHHFHPDQRRSL